MFSAAATYPRTSTAGAIRLIARIAPRTAAPPAMSRFWISMLPGGLSERPPESKQIPFPTSATTGGAGTRRGR